MYWLNFINSLRYVLLQPFTSSQFLISVNKFVWYIWLAVKYVHMVSLWLKGNFKWYQRKYFHDNKLFVSKCNGLKYKNSKECDPFMLQVYKEIIYYTPSFSALLLLVMVMWLLNRVDRNTLFQRKLWNWLQCTLTHFDAL